MKIILLASHMLAFVIAMIIGSSGQDGRILQANLSKLGYRILTIARNSIEFEGVSLDFQDMSDKQTAYSFLSYYQPNLIFHVAAIHGSSETQGSVIQAHGAEMRRCHVGITNNLLEWASRNLSTRIHIALSSQMYSPDRLIGSVTEESKTDPINLYGQTKSEAWELLRFYRNEFGVNVGGSILFNHASKYSRREFLFSQMADQFSEIYMGERSGIDLRNPHALIDISCAFEICQGMIDNVLHLPQEDFVFASGKNIRIAEIVMRAGELLGLSERMGNLDTFASLADEIERPILAACPKKAKDLLGWEAKKKPEAILQEMTYERLSERGIIGA